MAIAFSWPPPRVGLTRNPDWYYNLLASPAGVVEVGTEEFPVRATLVTEDPERADLYAKLVAHRRALPSTSRKPPARSRSSCWNGQNEDRATCNGL